MRLLPAVISIVLLSYPILRDGDVHPHRGASRRDLIAPVPPTPVYLEQPL